ncbi:hypothetical protein VTK26DRAFT_7503 [Humicola hyalothermophila]
MSLNNNPLPPSSSLPATHYSNQHRLPICTLPLPPRGKLYVISSPALMAAALRHRHLSLDEFIETFSVNALGLSGEERERFRSRPGYMEFLLKSVYPAFSGDALRGTAGAASRRIARALNEIGGGAEGQRQHEGTGEGDGACGEGLEVPDVTVWLRDMLCQAVMVGLYGEKNPVTVDIQGGIW